MTPRFTVNRLVVVASLWMTVTANHSFWSLVWRSHEHNLSLVVLLLSLLGAITSITFGVTRLLGPGPLLKPAISVLLIIAAVVSWFMDTYGVAIDPDMLRNALQTNVKEASDFFGMSLLWRVTWLAFAPMIFIWRCQVIPSASFARATVNYVLATLAGFVMVLVVGMPLYKQYASFFRNHQEARSLIAPGNLIDASVMLTKHTLRARQPYVQTGLDAKRIASAASKPLLVVLVVGETARAANFSLGGYARDTTPKLAKRQVFYFTDVSSCGTATAISIPCMFSELPREEFDVSRATRRDNVLDVIQRAGVQVHWIDNQGGCKGVCQRVPHDFAAQYSHASCNEETCPDDLLLQALSVKLPRVNQDTVLVLHAMGSHGPAYYRRSTPAFKPFQPECPTERIETCTTQQIVNAYDNSIVYTDHILDGLIGQLAQASDRIDSVLLYVSDHGESLGENGLYLHGQTYLIAPKVQKQVPMLLWFSPYAAARLKVDTACLRQQLDKPHSHDNLAHTLLTLTGVATHIYRPQLDLFDGCRSGSIQ